MPRNLPEADRKKNQFDKEERVHLLAIMKRYAPLLDNSPSTLARKKIWTTIEDEFKKAGFTRKTSAQLKKYWQNYKYHCKKATAFGKENKKYVETRANESVEWNRYQVFVENRCATKFSEIPGAVRSLPDHPQRSPMESDCKTDETFRNNNEGSPWKSNISDVFIDLSRVKEERNDDGTMSDDCQALGTNPLEDINHKEEEEEEEEEEEDRLEEKKEIFSNEQHSMPFSANSTEMKSKNCIVVSNAKISNNSVTVSVIYPENDSSRVPRSAIESLLATKGTAEVVWSDRLQKFSCLNSMKTQPVNTVNAMPFDYYDRMECGIDRTSVNEGNTNSGEYKSFERNASGDVSREKEIGEFSREDHREFAATESDENDGSELRSRNSGTRNDRFESRGYVFLTDYHNRLKHRLLLQQLETEEKRLKVKIAEMAIQEVQLRIKALSEDMRRTEELHRLRLAKVAAAGNVDV